MGKTKTIKEKKIDFKVLRSSSAMRGRLILTAFLSQSQILLESSDSYEFSKLIEMCKKKFEIIQQLQKQEILPLEAQDQNILELWKDLIDGFENVYKYCENKEPYQFQKYDFNRIHINFDALSIKVLPESLDAIPYLSTKEESLSTKDRDIIQKIYNRHSKDSYLYSEKFGSTPYREWTKKVSKKDFDTLLSIIGRYEDLVVKPDNMDLGFSFGIVVYAHTPSTFPGIPSENEDLISISEKWFPDEYTGKQVYDELVCNEWNRDHLMRYLNFFPESYSSYLY